MRCIFDFQKKKFPFAKIGQPPKMDNEIPSLSTPCLVFYFLRIATRVDTNMQRTFETFMSASGGNFVVVRMHVNSKDLDEPDPPTWKSGIAYFSNQHQIVLKHSMKEINSNTGVHYKVSQTIVKEDQLAENITVLFSYMKF